MSFTIQKGLAEIEAVRTDAHDLLDTLTDAQFNWRPSPERWSIGQCIHHLNLVGDLYDGEFSRAIATAREQNITGAGPFAHGALGGLFVRIMEPPVKMRANAPEKARPSEHLPLEQTRAEFFAIQERWLETFRSAEGIDLYNIKLPSALVGKFRLRLSAWMPAMIAHERRHLWQARQIRSHTDFPA